MGTIQKHQGEEEKSDVPCRKRKVLHLVSQWIALYRHRLHEDEHSKMFLKTIYRNVLDDVYEYPILEKELKEFQKILGMHRRHTVDEYSPQRKSKALFHQFSLKENWLQHRGTVTETEEIFCHVYITEHSYVSVKAKVSSTAQEILKVVAEKLQRAEEDLALVAIMFSGEKHEFQPNDLAVSKSLEASGRIFVYRKDLADTLQELIYFTFSRQGSGEHTVNLSLLLQRCNEVQLWVATEILLCSQLGKRVQVLKKFIKVAAHCKAQQNLNSFFAIVMGLNTASVSRLSQTWEKIPGKFKKLFSELESLTYHDIAIVSRCAWPAGGHGSRSSQCCHGVRGCWWPREQKLAVLSPCAWPAGGHGSRSSQCCHGWGVVRGLLVATEQKLAVLSRVRGLLVATGAEARSVVTVCVACWWPREQKLAVLSRCRGLLVATGAEAHSVVTVWRGLLVPREQKLAVLSPCAWPAGGHGSRSSQCCHGVRGLLVATGAEARSVVTVFVAMLVATEQKLAVLSPCAWPAGGHGSRSSQCCHDVTFIHEGNKTFLDNLVNFEKLHMIADTVRTLRHCRSNQFGSDMSPKDQQELKSYVNPLYVIDSQQALFELSHRLEPRA
ncbi:hypothetical protein U0070_024845 [Myodes glareolus]|uniref:Ras-GEF domain-containing protein n=1 Tax=Myodes glareolus TaxID=447135 RepID=A0AAW0I1H1_MYOGA